VSKGNARHKDQGTATLYLRVSQDKTGEGLAVERQESECRELCERNGWTVREVFTDNDISATKGKRRPGFEALLESNPERLVTWHTDRLVRLTKDLERVIDLGVNVHAVTAGHLDLSHPAGRAVARTITAWATYEGEQKSLRQQAKARQMAAEGKSWWPYRPFGFEMDGSHREAEAEALRKAYADLLSGRPLVQVIRDMNAAGHRTNRGNKWAHVAFRTMLLKPRNAGIRAYKGEEVGPAAWEGIVDEATYRAAVRLLTNPARKTTGDGKRVAMLSGVATCGKVRADGSVCGGMMTRAWRGGNRHAEHSYPVYECIRRDSTSQGEFTDGLVLRKVIERLSGTDASRWFSPTDDAIEGATGLHTKAEGIRSRLAELATAYADGLVTIGQMTSATETLRASLTAVEAQMGKGLHSSVLAGLDVEYVYQEWDGLDIHRQREIVMSVIESVVILPAGKGARVPQASNVVITFRN
jgi:site-specific DNA recombinase